MLLQMAELVSSSQSQACLGTTVKLQFVPEIKLTDCPEVAAASHCINRIEQENKVQAMDKTTSIDLAWL